METPSIDQESPVEGPWSDPALFSPVGNQDQRGQQSGPIRGAQRNSAMPYTAGHQNRAGHRLYARVNQNRQFRLNVLGMGRWRKNRRLTTGEPTWAAETAIPPQAPRWARRAQLIAYDKVTRQQNRRPGWRRP